MTQRNVNLRLLFCIVLLYNLGISKLLIGRLEMTVTIASPIRVLDSTPLNEWASEYTADICQALVHAYILTTDTPELYEASWVDFGKDWQLNFTSNKLNELGGALVEIYHNPKDPEYVGTVVVDYDN
jgi:hypothetical protein